MALREVARQPVGFLPGVLLPQRHRTVQLKVYAPLLDLHQRPVRSRGMCPSATTQVETGQARSVECEHVRAIQAGTAEPGADIGLIRVGLKGTLPHGTCGITHLFLFYRIGE